MKKNFKTMIVAAFALATVSSCRKYLTIEKPPLGNIYTSAVYNSNATATSAITSMYIAIRFGEFSNLISSGELSDELTNYSLTPNSFYSNNLLASNVSWDSGYYTIVYDANSALDGLAQSSTISPKVFAQLKAEAKFIRAYQYLLITNYWGAVPLMLTGDYKVNSVLSRSDQESVYQQIISDLKDAKTNLNSNYVDRTDTLTIVDRVRANKSAASALLARAYLYHKEWQNAINESSLVISNANYKLSSSLTDVFKKNSLEAILQIQPDLNIANGTPEAQGFVLLGPPSGAMDALSSQLLSAFEPNDNRKTQWVGVLKDPATNISYYYPAKYKALTGSPEYSTPLRLAEQYLIRAEAEAQLGNISSAVSDLNVIRNRAGLPNTTANSKDDLLSAILHERQVELFTEGHRWFDLKRTNNVDGVMSAVLPSKIGGGQWKPYMALLPIPQGDINLDHNLSQNPGY